MKKNIPSTISTIIIVMLLILIGGMYFHTKKLESISDQNFKASQDSLKIYVDKYDRVVAEKLTYTISLKNLIKSSELYVEATENMEPIVVVETVTKIEYRDSIQIVYQDVNLPEFHIPIKFKTKWLSFYGESSNFGINIDNITIPNTQTLVFGMKDNGWFKDSESIVRIINTNPHIESVSITGYNIKQKQSILKNKWLWLGLGVVSGVFIAK